MVGRGSSSQELCFFYEWFPCVGRIGNLGLGGSPAIRYMEALSGAFLV